MKRILLLLVVSCLAIAAKAQSTAAGYNFAASTGSYTALSGASNATVGTWNDTVVSGISLGFTFNYMGTAFTTVSISSNGWIALGTVTLTATTYTPVSTLGGGTNGIISASGCNLQSSSTNTDNITYLTTGSAGSRVFTVQYKSVRFSGSAATEAWNFQIKLYETSGIIQIVYGSATTPTTARTMQVGIRGTAVTDFNNRTTTTNWSATTIGTANTSTCTRSTTVQPASGLIYTWCPNAALPSVSVSAASGCSGASVTASGASTYSWAPLSSAGSATTGATVTHSPTITAQYSVTGTATNGCAAGTTYTALKPVVTATATATTVCPGTTTTLRATPDSTRYTVSSIAFTPIDTTGFTAATTGDETTTAATIPFNFTYFGSTFSSVNICSNGHINFGSSTTTGYSNLSAFPSTNFASGVTTGFVGLFLHDMNNSGTSLAGGTITFWYHRFSPEQKICC